MHVKDDCLSFVIPREMRDHVPVHFSLSFVDYKQTKTVNRKGQKKTVKQPCLGITGHLVSIVTGSLSLCKTVAQVPRARVQCA